MAHFMGHKVKSVGDGVKTTTKLGKQGEMVEKTIGKTAFTGTVSATLERGAMLKGIKRLEWWNLRVGTEGSWETWWIKNCKENTVKIDEEHPFAGLIEENKDNDLLPGYSFFHHNECWYHFSESQLSPPAWAWDHLGLVNALAERLRTQTASRTVRRDVYSL